MLFNITHPVGSGRLPSELLDLYIRYKQGTRAIINWLIQHSTQKYGTTMTIRDLGDLCEAVRAKPFSMPEMIDFCFRDTIAARRRLSRFFQVQNASHVDKDVTINHEYFTTWWETPQCFCR
jgi:hypothetical protein